MSAGFWFLLVVDAGISISVWLGQNWLKANIERSVQYKFDEKLEGVRTDLRKGEEGFRQQLQAKEAEIAALRGTVMGGLAARQAIVDKRRVEAVERLWEKFLELTPYATLTTFMASLSLDQISARAPTDPKLRYLIEALSKSSTEANALNHSQR